MTRHPAWCVPGLCETEDTTVYHRAEDETTDHKWSVGMSAVEDGGDVETTVFMHHPHKLPVEENGAMTLDEAEQLHRALGRILRAGRRSQNPDKSSDVTGSDDPSAFAGANCETGADYDRA